MLAFTVKRLGQVILRGLREVERCSRAIIAVPNASPSLIPSLLSAHLSLGQIFLASSLPYFLTSLPNDLLIMSSVKLLHVFSGRL